MPDFAGLRALGQLSMNAKDQERATAFYRDVLGVPFLFQAPKMAFFDLEGVRLMLASPESAAYDHPGSILYFRVGDIREAHATLAARGVTFDTEPQMIADMGDHELWMAFFKDTEGNQLALMAEIPLTRGRRAPYSS
ncbi:MAG: VOC family protein [Gemmatimonadetes bacterium]|nr:VOC family protein [Gemmatimonadota bacterium]